MNWRLIWYKATHHCISRDNWLLIIGPSFWDRDYGITFNRGLLPPTPGPFEDWKRWRVEWRVNIRWPISIRRRTVRPRQTPNNNIW